MDDERGNGGLNPSQRRHLLSSCQYADKLLSEIESVLAASQSKSPFPKFRADVSPAQAKVISDYIARIRDQVVRVLESQGVTIPDPHIGASHSVRVTLEFLDIAFEECRPKRMAGYGEIGSMASTAMSGLVDEMQGIIARLAAYLAQGEFADLQSRLRRLEEAGAGIALVKTLERTIDRNGLVEFRPALTTIVERLESGSFEIAVFGRVSSGKSSLLNYVVGREVLPVGVNPVTAVPTRLRFGEEARATAWFADRKPEHFEIGRLAEFVTEEHNPSNALHVTRIVVALPAARLREGIVYVDTPGLGSLASSGAAETKAYLPRCDLGVVLIDAGSTLTQDDLSTIRALYDAGIPASILLSKADVLAPPDRELARRYIADHVRSDLGVELPVYPVSIKDGYSSLLETWLDTRIIPLYDRHAQLAQESLNRKIGALRLGVEAAINARLKRRQHGAQVDLTKLRELESELRTAAGRIAEERAKCIGLSDALRESAGQFIRTAAGSLIEEAGSARAAAEKHPVEVAIERLAAERAAGIVSSVRDAATRAEDALLKTGKALDTENSPDSYDFATVITDMPRLDAGSLEGGGLQNRRRSVFGRAWAIRRLERGLRTQFGRQIEDAVSVWARVVQAWVRRTFSELQERFDSSADAYRAQLGRLLADPDAKADDSQALRGDLAALAAAGNSAENGRKAPGAAARKAAEP